PRVAARLGGSPAVVASGIAVCIRAIARRDGTLGREAAREGEVSDRTRRRRGLLSRRSLGRNRDDRCAVDTSRTDRPLRASRTLRPSGTDEALGASRTGKPPQATETLDAALADLAPVAGLLHFPHHVRLLGNAEWASQRSRPMMR